MTSILGDGAGGTGPQEGGVVEYDADSEDDRWLENCNRGQDRLSHQKFELMMWRLELANAAANDRTLMAAGKSNEKKCREITAEIHIYCKDALQFFSPTHPAPTQASKRKF